jgi:parallel beta-helix repeat protein
MPPPPLRGLAPPNPKQGVYMRRSTLLVLSLGMLALVLPAASSARTINVHPGQSIQRAVDRAHDGDRIFINPGVYRERGRPCPNRPSRICAVAITKDDISLIGKGNKRKKVVIQDRGGQARGIDVGKTSDASCLTDPEQRVHGSYISNVEVNGFDVFGIFLFCVDNWRVTNVQTHDDIVYGIFPSHVGQGRVDHSVATGANDTGIYIGQSHDVEIDHNVASDNVSGFEIENSANTSTHDNEAFGNTGGILTFTLPGLDVTSNNDNEISNNNVHDNDRPNTCLDPDDAVCGVPRGTGILALAVDRNSIHNNSVTGNDTFGIALANYCTGNPCNPVPTDIDIFPNDNRIVNNVATGNGTNPDPNVPSIFAVDLAWDFTGTGNCWSGNTAGSAFPSTLPPCP